MNRIKAVLTRPIPAFCFMLAISILLLNMVDALFTLRHIEHGAEELNPLMSLILHHGTLIFVLAKHLFVGFGLFVILYGAGLGKQVKWSLVGCAALFAGIDIYHTVLWIIV